MNLIGKVIKAAIDGASSMRSQRLRRGAKGGESAGETPAAEATKGTKEEEKPEPEPEKPAADEAAAAKDAAKKDEAPNAETEALKEEEEKVASLLEGKKEGGDATAKADDNKEEEGAKKKTTGPPKKEGATGPKKKDDAATTGGFKSQYEREMAVRSGLIGPPGPYGPPGMGGPPGSGGGGFPGMGPMGGMDPSAAMYGYNPYYAHPYMMSMPLPTPHQLRTGYNVGGVGPGGPLPTPHEVKSASSSAKNFPETLYDVINTQRHNHIVAWLPHGKGFMIHEKQLFGKTILPAYFDGAKFTSFTRRLKRWRFERVPRGPEMGAYYNKYFVRDRPDLVKKMSYHPSDEPPEKDLKEQEDKKEEGAEESAAKDAGDEREGEGESPAKKKRKKRKQNAYPNHEPAPKIPSPDLGPAAPPPYPPGLGGYPGGMAGYPGMGGVPPGPPGGMGPNEARLAELERQIAMERSGMGGGGGGFPGGPMGMPYGGVPPGGSPAGPGAPPVVSSPYDVKAADLERRKRILEAERVLAEEKGGGGGGQGEPQRPVMMSKTEEKEFADFLAAKRGAFPG